MFFYLLFRVACKDCCSQLEAAIPRLAARLNGVSVGRLTQDDPFLTLNEIVYDSEPFAGTPKKITLLFMCDGEQEKLAAFAQQQAKAPDYNPNQKYRIWGQIYEVDSLTTFIPDREYALKIDRIEKMD
ncbi:hypothetical protein [Fibrivirga algicola]|uniref:Uncharacterized protein n=1 Tax=Fibrivirga algicola TaxID=2950420 RepID=A0ABX0QEY1_9BACT|nr:hypothetical protein [Fibrivirga algicola]NID09542.1 hypothetical protein [Fibrivirga algicola]